MKYGVTFLGFFRLVNTLQKCKVGFVFLNQFIDMEKGWWKINNSQKMLDWI